MAIAGLLLAAGASRRLGTPKQLLRGVDGAPLVARAAKQLVDAGCSPVYVVLGAEGDAIAAAVAELPVRCVRHDRWTEGMGTSIAAGIRALAVDDDGPALLAGVLIMACDMPAVTTEHLATLIAESGGERRVASRYTRADGTSIAGIPALLPRSDWAWLRTLDGDQGARTLLRRDDTHTVPLENGALDLDTVNDVARWRATWAG